MGEPAAAGWAFIVPSTSSPVKQSYRNGKQPFYDVEVLELGKVTNVVRETGRLARSKRIEANARIPLVQSQTTSMALCDPVTEKEAQIAFQWD